ncbi:MAG: hypothetical protein K6F56_09970 [Oscillospiraceae bacterium]|nr:hypothetical protein [Oscillospiraceae bacterium]
MSTALRELIALSLLMGLSLHLCPESGVRRVLTVLCAALLGLSILRPFKDFDYDVFALETAKLREAELTISREGEQASQRLNRLFIEEEYAAYVQNRAEQLGVSGLKAEIQTEWAYDGLWVPYASHITGSVDTSERAALERMLREELGIPAERQYWYADG